MRTRSSLVSFVAIAAAALAVGCTPQPDPTPETVVPESATFQQFQSIPNFDDALYFVDDAAALAELGAVLSNNDLVEQDYAETSNTQPGALTTTLVVTWDSGVTNTIQVGGAENPSDFDQQITELVSDWRLSGDFEPVNVP